MIKFETERMIMKADLKLINGKIEYPKVEKGINIWDLKPMNNSFRFYDKKDENCNICHIGIREDRKTMEICYGVEEKFRNQKFMKEALSAFIIWIFENTNENEINALICNNPISQHILESCGFVENGQYKNANEKWFTLNKKREL